MPVRTENEQKFVLFRNFLRKQNESLPHEKQRVRGKAREDPERSSLA